MRTIELTYGPGDECWVRGQNRACYIESVMLEEQGITYNWVNYDFGVDCTEVWDDGSFTSDDIGVTVFSTLEELEKAFPEDFAFDCGMEGF